MTGWLTFALFVAVGLVDLILGFVYARGAAREVGAPPPASGQNSPQSRRFLGRVLMVSAFVMWGLAGAFAYGVFGPDLALPIFTQSVTE